MEETYPIAWVVGETESQWIVECPYGCGKHYHGKGPGHRVAHCNSKEVPQSDPGYIVLPFERQWAKVVNSTATSDEAAFRRAMKRWEAA